MIDPKVDTIPAYVFESAQPLKRWCGICENVLVDSAKRDTGRFFCMNGYKLKPNREVMNLRSFVEIVFSVCHLCMADIRCDGIHKE